MERTVQDAKTYDRFQFERVGFFSVDPDSAQTEAGKVRVIDGIDSLVRFSQRNALLRYIQ